jgi:hypothetical protein
MASTSAATTTTASVKEKEEKHVGKKKAPEQQPLVDDAQKNAALKAYYADLIARRDKASIAYPRLSVEETARLLVYCTGIAHCFGQDERAWPLIVEEFERRTLTHRLADMEAKWNGEKLQFFAAQMFYDVPNNMRVQDLENMFYKGLCFSSWILEKVADEGSDYTDVLEAMMYMETPPTAWSVFGLRNLIVKRTEELEKHEDDSHIEYLKRCMTLFIRNLSADQMEHVGHATWSTRPDNPCYPVYVKSIRHGLDMSCLSNVDGYRVIQDDDPKMQQLAQRGWYHAHASRFDVHQPDGKIGELDYPSSILCAEVNYCIQTATASLYAVLAPLPMDMIELIMEFTISRHDVYDVTPAQNMRFGHVSWPKNEVTFKAITADQVEARIKQAEEAEAARVEVRDARRKLAAVAASAAALARGAVGVP